jgi:hypothetical protein
MTRSFARADSFTVRSMVAFFRTASTQLLGDLLQGFIAQHFNDAVVDLK